MKATVRRGALVRELHHVDKVAPRESGIPVIQNVSIKADKLSLELLATDLDISLRTGCEAEIDRAGRVCVPAKRLFDVIRSLPGDEVLLEVPPGKEGLVVTSGPSRFTLLGLPPDDFPTVPAYPKRSYIEIPASVLRTLLPRVSFAITQEDARHYLAGALVVIENGSVSVVATDGHRMPYTRRSKVSTVPPNVTASHILPRKAVEEIERLLEGAETVLFWPPEEENSGRHAFDIGGRLLTCKTIEGKFPAYEKVIGKSGDTRVELSRADVDAAVRRVSILATGRSSGVKLTVEAGALVLEAQSPDAGDARDSVPGEVSGPKAFSALNTTYVLQALGSMATERVAIDLSSNPESQVRFCPVGLPADEIHECVVMPMRL